MLLRGWLLLLLPVLGVLSQDATGTCNNALGLLSGAIEDPSITSPLGEDSTPSAGRLDNSDGAWCFNSDSIAKHSAVLLIDLGRRRFVSGFGSQGPPEKIHPKSYNHLIAFSTSFSLDQTTWEEFNGGSLFFVTDKNDTSDVISYHMSSTVALTQYVKINVTMHVSGSTTICLRFELYGCDTAIQPRTSVQALTTPKGKIQVKWMQPVIETSLGSDNSSIGILSPGGYAVLYRPMESQTFATAAANDKLIALEDVRLGATYVIQLQCLYKDIVVNCGSTQVEAYPPCPEGFTGGNEYHCFLYLSPVASFAEARTSCLNPDFDQQLGQLGYIVDEDERKFLVSRILPKSISEVWLIGNLCQEKEDCCTILKVSGKDTLEDAACGEKSLKSALCLRDHKGEGARLRVSKVESSADGSSASVTWRYEGIGWKTDQLQVKMWQTSEAQASTLTFTTLSETFEIKAVAGTMYSLLLRPAPNIRTEEFVYKFIIIDFQEGTARYGAVLTPVPMSVYIIWSGSLRVTWDEAKALSKSGEARPTNKYSIAHQTAAPGSVSTEVVLESKREFQLTPIEMKATYVFKMACHFANKFQPCGEITITTDPPDLVLYKPSKVYIIYETILDKAKTWPEAEDDCQQRAGHLTSLLDDAEAKALLKMLPNKDAKMWTGAKLGRKGTGYWTDGEKITDLPMAKNSGVTSSSESCCRAINEMGKLRLAGGNCEDRHPYICKYTVQEIMAVPGNVAAAAFKWNSFDLSWSKPVQRWLPTFYNVQACQVESKTECKVKKDLKNLWALKLDNLQEFQNYSVAVEAVLEPVDVKTTGEITVMTYPKSQVQISISPSGKCTTSTPILVAKGLPTATVTMVLSQLDATVATVKGGLKDVVVPGLVPEEVYKLVVKQDGGDWTQEMSINAVPNCPETEALVDSVCYHTKSKMPRSSEEAKKYCLGVQPTQERNPMSLWSPQSMDGLIKVMTGVDPYSNAWVDKPKDGSISNIESDAGCSTGGEPKCFFYDVSKSKLARSACCDRKLTFICSHTIKKPNLGEVTNLLPSFVGNTSIGVQWNPPNDISWSIKRFEVEWRDKEKNNAVVGKDILVGATEKKIEGLEFGNEYEVAVTPLGATAFRGETAIILITTLDPRNPIVANVDPDGTARVHSPILTEKGRGSEQVDVRLFKIDGLTQDRSLLHTVSGQAQKVDITGLELGRRYWVEMTPKEKTKMFNYSTEFSAFPSCAEGQIQEGLVCVWAPAQPKSWREAAEICREDSGDLLDYRTQEGLTQPVKALLTSYIQQKFWLDISGSEATKDYDSSKCVNGVESDVMCCTYEVSEKGELNDLKCACCDEPRPYACKKLAKINLGDIGEVLVEDITATSLTVGWTMSSSTKWQEPSFMITWKEVSNRQKREVGSQMITTKSPASVTDLKSATEYKVSVAPYAEATKSSGDSKEVTVSTRTGVTMAGLMQEAGCTIIILKISCCVTVILGCSFTVFVFIATRMFYLDCLAQMFAELGTFGAYVCILVSSAQSYSNDSQCLQAHPTLCVAVAVLIQFFFQVVFLFIFLETLLICSTLKEYLPSFCNYRSPLGLAASGFGIPAIMMIVLAAVASDGFSDGNDNCWLDLQGTAMLPSVIPVVVFGSFACFLLLSVFDVDEPKEDLSALQKIRGRIFLKTRWACFAVFALMTVCYATGMTGANDRDAILNYVFIGFSTAMGILIPVFRIKCDDEVREQLKRGLFTSLRDDMGTIRVSPAPGKFDPNPLLNMSEFESRKYKQQQLEGLKNKESINTETVWHQ